jgi:hypothetical protein
MSLGLGTQDMMDFQTSYDREKSAQSRLLKAKFTVKHSLQFYDLLSCNNNHRN